MLTDWVNKKYLDAEKVRRLSKRFHSAKPYPHLALKDFLKKDKAELLMQELRQEEFYPKESDLFRMRQTNDFISAKGPALREFRDLLASDEFISFMQDVTNEPLKAGAIDAGGSIYSDACFLLPHDDRLEGRNIAYMLYLTTMRDEDGGALCLYSSRKGRPTKVKRKLLPQFNTFTFFKVSTVSYHQVEEVVSDKERLSINGWFHDK